MTKPKQPVVTTQLCCGECFFCHPDPEDKKQSACFVEPPQLSHWEQDSPVFVEYKLVSSRRPTCCKFAPKEKH